MTPFFDEQSRNRVRSGDLEAVIMTEYNEKDRLKGIN
jgi:hypothetical protein